MHTERYASVDSISIYRTFWLCWQLLGISISFSNAAATYKRYLCATYDLLMNVLITIAYPLHLMVGLFMVPTRAEVFKNLAIAITCVMCSVKHYLFRWQLPNIRRVEKLLRQLDARIVDDDERAYFSARTMPRNRRILLLFSVVYAGDCLASSMDTLLSSERRLMYPTWLPFDWRASAGAYYAAICYQIVGVGIQIMQNLANDTYAPTTLCTVCGHVRVLSLRIAKIGNSGDRSTQQNNAELIACVEDHKRLLSIFELLQQIFWWTQLAQFLASGVNICLSIVYVLLYEKNFFGYLYYSIYFLSMSIELLPVCYYGSKLQQELHNLPYAIFSCNWSAQSKAFNQNQRIFTSLAMKTYTPSAGGVISIHLNAFVGTCKMAYSLYTVLMQMK